MDKPIPYTETKQIMNFIDMQRWIDEKYNIAARDYAGHFGKAPKWIDVVAQHGVSLERAKELWDIIPADIVDPIEQAAYAAACKAADDWQDATPYQDFWHFQLTLFENFSNDSYQTLNLKYQMEACQEDWQREIAQMWLDEFSEYADDYGRIALWVCW